VVRWLHAGFSGSRGTHMGGYMPSGSPHGCTRGRVYEIRVRSPAARFTAGKRAPKLGLDGCTGSL
jgi:hypothetical protein